VLPSTPDVEYGNVMNVSIQLRVAAVLLVVNGLGFGVFCIPAIRNLLQGRDLPVVMGFPAYGRGPFERLGIPTTVPLLAGFLFVCALEILAGVLLWGGSKGGAYLAFALLPAAAVFWWGFALPFGPLLALISTVLIVLGWRGLG
jgi:hypothetical protein